MLQFVRHVRLQLNKVLLLHLEALLALASGLSDYLLEVVNVFYHDLLLGRFRIFTTRSHHLGRKFKLFLRIVCFVRGRSQFSLRIVAPRVLLEGV